MAAKEPLLVIRLIAHDRMRGAARDIYIVIDPKTGGTLDAIPSGKRRDKTVSDKYANPLIWGPSIDLIPEEYEALRKRFLPMV